ncbi:MAG: DUF72 domain-containing protein [Deltaproteobacteria bacterium]|nr:DUF72 domain-containing protein [Deltaproteobacteria bacterium]
MKDGRLRAATSGWHYGHWRGPFYPERLPKRDYLRFYSAHFDTVEINNSFYRLPDESTLKNWRSSTPEGFVFSVKAPRQITHNKKLKDPDSTLPPFLERIRTLGEKLGPVLFQLPPRWNADAGRLREFLDALPEGLRCAFEFRNAGWFTAEVYDMLRDRNSAFCIYGLAGTESPRKVTADFVYVRLHGPTEAYSGSYSDAALLDWAEEASAWLDEGKDVYFYFDNDEAGHAVEDALRFKQKVEGLRSVKR